LKSFNSVTPKYSVSKASLQLYREGNWSCQGWLLRRQYRTFLRC